MYDYSKFIYKRFKIYFFIRFKEDHNYFSFLNEIKDCPKDILISSEDNVFDVQNENVSHVEREKGSALRFSSATLLSPMLRKLGTSTNSGIISCAWCPPWAKWDAKTPWSGASGFKSSATPSSTTSSMLSNGAAMHCSECQWKNL